MSSNTVRYLKALVSEGSFSRAAHALDISQPSLSQFLMRLETEAGAELIDRTVKPLRLTSAGEIYLDAEEKVEALRSDCIKRMNDIKAGVRGRVVIGASDYRETYFLAEVLPIFRARYPMIELSFAEGRTKELEEFAMAGVTDFSLVISPLCHPTELEMTPIYPERLVIAMNAQHPIARRIPPSEDGEFPFLDFKELDREPFLVMKKGQKMNRHFYEYCDRTGAEPRVVLESESMIAANALAGAGLGVTMTTETIARRSKTPYDMRYFRVLPEMPDRIVVAAYRSEKLLSKAAKSLINVMTEVARERFAHG